MRQTLEGHIAANATALAAMRSMPGQLTPPDQKALLATRETVWRAFFSNDQSQLEKLVPNEALVVDELNPGGIGKRADIFEAAKKFAEGGTKLTRLEFPRTEMQVYGDTAILYMTYSFEVEKGDRRITQTGRGTEIFVKRNGSWLNTGWQLDSDK